MEWPEIVKAVGGHVDYFKLDIEGGEFDLLESIVRSESRPTQIQLEVHVETNFNMTMCRNRVKNLFNILHQEYSTVYRRDNPVCTSCSEVLLVKN